MEQKNPIYLILQLDTSSLTEALQTALKINSEMKIKIYDVFDSCDRFKFSPKYIKMLQHGLCTEEDYKEKFSINKYKNVK